MTATDQMRAMLDQLMGTARNEGKNENASDSDDEEQNEPQAEEKLSQSKIKEVFNLIEKASEIIQLNDDEKRAMEIRKNIWEAVESYKQLYNRNKGILQHKSIDSYFKTS